MKKTYLILFSVTIFYPVMTCANENVISSETEHAFDRAEKAFYSTEWHELPDEHLINPARVKWNRLAKAALNLPEWMELGFSQRTRFESSSHPWHTGQSSETNQQLPLLSRIRFGANNENLGFIFEGQDGRTNFNHSGDFTGGANSLVNTFDVLQLYTSATLHNIADMGLRADLDIGRFTMDVGSSRLMGRNNYENITFSYEGAHFDIGAENKDWRLRTYFVSPVARYPNQADESSRNRLVWGVDLEGKPTSWLNSDVYYLGINDNKSPIIANHRSFSAFGTRAYQLPAKIADVKQRSSGVFDYDFETTIETGEKGIKDFFAYYGHAEIGYTFNAPWFPRLMADYDYSSGTENPNGGTNNTFDRLYGPRANMSVTSLFGPMFQTNMEYGGLRLVTQPLDNIKLNLKHHVWYLAEAKDAMANSASTTADKNLQDKTGSAGRYLGQDVEFTTTWSLRSNLTLEAGYEHWFKGDYFSRLPKTGNPHQDLPNGGEKDTDFFYVSSELRF